MENLDSFCTTDCLIEKAQSDNVETLWDRKDAQKSKCGFGDQGLCCRLCAMGPCRINPSTEKGAQKGICGADRDTIVARHLSRMVAAGTASHSDHARSIAQVVSKLNENSDFKIADEEKLLAIAKEWNIETENLNKYEIANRVGETALMEFGKLEGTMRFIDRVPEPRQELWKNLSILPEAIDKEIVGLMHATAMGSSSDPLHIMAMSLKTSLADGWGGSMIGTELSDILFGKPTPRVTEADLGVLQTDQINILLHGHEPTLSEMIVLATEDPELLDLAKKEGAKGINLVGTCCTANEVSMRHGIKIAGNFHQQELAVVTGAVEIVLVDVQCIFPSLADVAKCYHTKLITTSSKAKIKGATHIEFKEETAYQTAKEIVNLAIENYRNRKPEKVMIPKQKMSATVGFSFEAIAKALTDKSEDNDGLKLFVETVKNGAIKGVAAIVGCNNPKIKGDEAHRNIIKNLIENDILVVATGCAAQAAAKVGFMHNDALDYAGAGLRQACNFLGIPPVLHMGSCVDNSRILTLTAALANYLQADISDLPIAGVAPEWMSEKAVAIACYVVASGIDTFLGVTPQITGSEYVVELLTENIEELTKSKFYVNDDFNELSEMIVDRIQEKRNRLGFEN